LHSVLARPLPFSTLFRSRLTSCMCPRGQPDWPADSTNAGTGGTLSGSPLAQETAGLPQDLLRLGDQATDDVGARGETVDQSRRLDRKSTRQNSSHEESTY